jgi:hypothetical protein
VAAQRPDVRSANLRPAPHVPRAGAEPRSSPAPAPTLAAAVGQPFDRGGIATPGRRAAAAHDIRRSPRAGCGRAGRRADRRPRRGVREPSAGYPAPAATTPPEAAAAAGTGRTRPGRSAARAATPAPRRAGGCEPARSAGRSAPRWGTRARTPGSPDIGRGAARRWSRAPVRRPRPGS